MATDLRIVADNRPGVLASLSKTLGDAGINIEGFCGVATGVRGAIHVLVDQAGAARQALESAGFTVEAEREAIVIDSVTDAPGVLGELTGKVSDLGVNLEVAYLATNTRLVLVADDTERARAAL